MFNTQKIVVTFSLNTHGCTTKNVVHLAIINNNPDFEILVIMKIVLIEFIRSKILHSII